VGESDFGGDCKVILTKSHRRGNFFTRLNLFLDVFKKAAVSFQLPVSMRSEITRAARTRGLERGGV
jgi:hypothetical protein